MEISFLNTKVCGNVVLMLKYPFIPVRDFSFILRKYLHFICFVENLRTSLRKIYGKYISRSFLCNFVRPKFWDKLSVNVDHVYWSVCPFFVGKKEVYEGDGFRDEGLVICLSLKPKLIYLCNTKSIFSLQVKK